MAVLATFLLELSNPAIGRKQYFECDGNVLFPTVVCSLDKRGFFRRQTLTRTVVAQRRNAPATASFQQQCQSSNNVIAFTSSFLRGNDVVEAMTS